jgi:hypothetical protein
MAGIQFALSQLLTILKCALKITCLGIVEMSDLTILKQGIQFNRPVVSTWKIDE